MYFHRDSREYDLSPQSVSDSNGLHAQAQQVLKRYCRRLHTPADAIKFGLASGPSRRDSRLGLSVRVARWCFGLCDPPDCRRGALSGRRNATTLRVAVRLLPARGAGPILLFGNWMPILQQRMKRMNTNQPGQHQDPQSPQKSHPPGGPDPQRKPSQGTPNPGGGKGEHGTDRPRPGEGSSDRQPDKQPRKQP
jgi:hypothetical protein